MARYDVCDINGIVLATVDADDADHAKEIFIDSCFAIVAEEEEDESCEECGHGDGFHSDDCSRCI